MRQNKPTRFVAEGSDPSESRRINKIGHASVNTSALYIQDVSTLDEYEAGCRVHEDCSGHMVRTPSGLLLPPQYMAIKTNIIKNEVHLAAQHAFASPLTPYHRNEYFTILSKMMKAKEGKMRSNVLAGAVDGSLRMVVIPHVEGDANSDWECPVTKKIVKSYKVVFLPYYLRDKFKVIRLDTNIGRYVSDYVKDGDCAYMVREPALDSGSNPLVYIYYWDKTAMGAHPRLMKGLKGDYDGDELHLYPLYSDEAVKCCHKWEVDIHPDFDKAEKIYANTYFPDKGEGSLDFMWHTTMSFKEIKEGYPAPLMCEYNRMKLESIEMFRQRSDPKETARTLIKSSIEGLNSINIQQHSQSIVGDMSRIARLAASSVKQKEDGTIYITGSNNMNHTYLSQVDKDSGNTAVRAISRLCATAQQAMLSAHRVSKTAMPSHDMIKDLVVGAEYTFLIAKPGIMALFSGIDNKDTVIKWHANIDNQMYILCQPSIITILMRTYIVAAHNPHILKMVAKSKRFDVCRRSIEKVFVQYDVPLSDVELDSLTLLYTYEIAKSTMPITSREGLQKRSLHWTEIATATSYSHLCEMTKFKDIEPVDVNTITSALMSRNFSLLE